MAIVVTFTLVDKWGRVTSKGFETLETTLAAAATSAASLLTDILAATELGSLSVTYTQKEIANNAAGDPSNVDEGATIRCRLDNGKLYPFKLPAPEAAIRMAGGVIDVSNVLVTDLLANFMSAGRFRVSEGNYIVSIIDGELDR